MKLVFQAVKGSIAAALILPIAQQIAVLPAYATHTGTQNYGDVIIVRNADGSIESREAGGGSHNSAYKAAKRFHPPSAKHNPTSATTYGASATGKKGNRPMAITQSPAGCHSNKKRIARSLPTAHAISGQRDDDLIITRHPDGSVEIHEAK
jgi:hypothetical protein